MDNITEVLPFSTYFNTSHQCMQNMKLQCKIKANLAKFTVYIILTILTCRCEQQKRHHYPIIPCSL